MASARSFVLATHLSVCRAHARVCLSVYVFLCVYVLFVIPRHRGTAISSISAAALCMCVRLCMCVAVSSFWRGCLVDFGGTFVHLCVYDCNCVLFAFVIGIGGLLFRNFGRTSVCVCLHASACAHVCVQGRAETCRAPLLYS